jgi:putative transposase
MNTPPTTNLYKRHRFPAEIISHCVWLYFRFCLSYHDVEELMAERGVILTYKAVWCRNFGRVYANQLRHRRPQPGDKWHLDEVFLMQCPRTVYTDLISLRLLATFGETGSYSRH